MCKIIQATCIDSWYTAFLFVYEIAALIIEQPLSWNSHMEIVSISHLGMRPVPLISLVWSWLFHFNVVFVKVFSVDCALTRAFCVLLFSNQQQKREIHVIKLSFLLYWIYIKPNERYRAGFYFCLFLFYSFWKLNDVWVSDFPLYIDIFENTSIYSWDKCKEIFIMSRCCIDWYLVWELHFDLVQTCIHLNEQLQNYGEHACIQDPILGFDTKKKKKKDCYFSLLKNALKNLEISLIWRKGWSLALA